MKPADLEQAASNWRVQMAPLYERRTGPRKLALEPELAPATHWNPSLPGKKPISTTLCPAMTPISHLLR